MFKYHCIALDLCRTWSFICCQAKRVEQLDGIVQVEDNLLSYLITRSCDNNVEGIFYLGGVSLFLQLLKSSLFFFLLVFWFFWGGVGGVERIFSSK